MLIRSFYVESMNLPYFADNLEKNSTFKFFDSDPPIAIHLPTILTTSIQYIALNSNFGKKFNSELVQ